MSPVQYSADEIHRLQVTLVTDFLEMAADAGQEINPDDLKACAMLLAGAAHLAEAPDLPVSYKADFSCEADTEPDGEVFAEGEVPDGIEINAPQD
jgi:hypothetical protein